MRPLLHLWRCAPDDNDDKLPAIFEGVAAAVGDRQDVVNLLGLAGAATQLQHAQHPRIRLWCSARRWPTDRGGHRQWHWPSSLIRGCAAAPASEQAPFPETHSLYFGGLPSAKGPLAERLAGHGLVVVGAPVFRYYPFIDGSYLPDGANCGKLPTTAGRRRAPRLATACSRMRSWRSVNSPSWWPNASGNVHSRRAGTSDGTTSAERQASRRNALCPCHFRQASRYSTC